MNKDTLERLRETVLVPHGDPQLVLYTKLVVGLLWLVHLPLGFLYGASLPFYLLLVGLMLLAGVNLSLSCRTSEIVSRCITNPRIRYSLYSVQMMNSGNLFQWCIIHTGNF